MSEELKNVTEAADSSSEQYSLNDDRRVKVLSPGAMVAKRFFRNRLAVTGLVILVFMFVFSFVGGMVSPYEEDQVFYRTDMQFKEYAAVTKNEEFRFANAEKEVAYDSILQAQTILALTKKTDSFTWKDVEYGVTQEGENFYSISHNGEVIGMAFKDIVSSTIEGVELSFDQRFAMLKAFTNGETGFSLDGVDYSVTEDGGVTTADGEVAFVSSYVIQSIHADVFLTRAFKEEVVAAIEAGEEVFPFTNEAGESCEYKLSFDVTKNMWSIQEEKGVQVFDTYSYPSKEHWLGTDKNGMDMLTRIMYGGRVSLIIGFIVVVISTVLGVILGGMSGFFGGWVDMLIMRIVDIFYCIPSMPIIIILGAVMDGMRVDPTLRMLYLMLILGFLGWPGIARLVRGQILSLREQEFMVAAEATGIKIHNRIFKHLIPNVIPQLIVVCTMSLGSTIITEATLSFLGLGVKFPFASWGNIINDVNDTFVLTTYWFIWIPAGICLLLTVLAFNILGDGLRDAFDPKMKR